jgi:hypothetical protein
VSSPRKDSRTRWWLARLGAAALGTLAALIVAEVALRLALAYLPIAMADALGTGYVGYGNGIYRFDPALNMERMRPHYRRQMFFNGYFWRHQTDWMGFRNPSDLSHYDIVLIGDSIVYGHGVEEESTISSHLERLLGRSVANLGVQGGAMDTEYEVLRHDAVRLSPQWVFIFFLNNDIEDVEQRLTDSEMLRFLELPVEDHATRYFIVRGRKQDTGNFDWRNFYMVRCYGLLKRLVKRKLERRASPQPAAAGSGNSGPPALAPAAVMTSPQWATQPPFAGNPRMQLAMRFHLRAIAKSEDFARRHHFHFVYIFVAVPKPYDEFYERVIGEFCRRNQIEFFSLRRTYEAAQRAGVRLFLPHDGHLTGAGARVTAQALAARFDLQALSVRR